MKNSILFCLLLLLITGCRQNINNMNNLTIFERDSTSNLTIFETEEGLRGVADAHGDVIIKPEYNHILLCGPFITVKIPDKEFQKEIEKLAKKAGIDDDFKPGDEIKEVKHEFIVPGYGNSYYRLYNSSGKKLTDYPFRSAGLWTPIMGDSIVWKNDYIHIDPSERGIFIISTKGKKTKIKDYWIGKKYWGYLDSENLLHEKMAGGVWHDLWGIPIMTVRDLLITKGCVSDLKDRTVTVFNKNGKMSYIDGYDIVGWGVDRDKDGVFVKCLEGEEMRGEKRSDSERPKKFFYITQDGKVNEIPAGYYTKDEYDYNGIDTYLHAPSGRIIKMKRD